MITRFTTVAAMMLCATLFLVSPVYGDAVVYWNEVTLGAVTAGRPGPPGMFDVALVQAAVHDAVQAIEGRYEPYHYADSSRHGLGSTDAAVAAATRHTLLLLYPGQQSQIDTIYETFIGSKSLAGDAGLATGEAAAVSVHGAHYRAPIVVAPFYGKDEIGQWHSTVPMAALYSAFVRPFTLNTAWQFRPPPPAPLVSGSYARDYNEVREIGDARAHPNADTDLARFWSVNFFTQWNDAVRRIAANHLFGEGDRARLLALANLAGADAIIAIWDSKYHFNFWRPSAAIVRGNADGNDKTLGDPSWKALFADPPYPDYVSGANGVTGAFTGMLREFFGGDDLVFSVKTTAPQIGSQERHYTTISAAAQEVVDARILMGIHFRFADTEGRRLGERVAHWTFEKFLRPAE
jgi:hypothetical protein